jgi:hypothetical protein
MALLLLAKLLALSFASIGRTILLMQMLSLNLCGAHLVKNNMFNGLLVAQLYLSLLFARSLVFIQDL